MLRALLTLALTAGTAAAVPSPHPAGAAPGEGQQVAPAKPAPEQSTATPAEPLAPDVPAGAAPPAAPKGPMTLLMRGLDKITGKPTNIVAPVGKPVQFATLTIVARYCYSTPPSEPPETTAFVQIEDRRPDQPAKQVFSGWMYASSPGLNGLQHPLYDVWVISCRPGTPGAAPLVAAAQAPAKVLSPDSSDKEGMVALPADAGQ